VVIFMPIFRSAGIRPSLARNGTNAQELLPLKVHDRILSLLRTNVEAVHVRLGKTQFKLSAVLWAHFEEMEVALGYPGCATRQRRSSHSAQEREEVQV
jgi:hypothetical protein